METPDPKSSQLARFQEAARQVGADESDDALDRAMGKLDLRSKPKPAPPVPKESDDGRSD